MSSTSLMDRITQYATPFLSLSYPTDAPTNPDSFYTSNYYNTGPQDVCLVITCIAIMAILRDAFRLGVFEPFAHWKLTRDLRKVRAKRSIAIGNGKSNGNGTANGNGKLNGNGVANGNGIANGHGHATTTTSYNTAKEDRKVHRKVIRFAEQGWPAIYYPLQWAYGLYLHRNLPTRVLDPIDLWLNYPHIPIPGTLKFYYLTQFAFYLHQVLILNAEARRKDHAQMMTHHVVTVTLMAMSYFTNFTRVGCLIMVLMDWCDIFLPAAKMMRYLDVNQLICDGTFAWFLISWFVTRHILFVIVIYSTYTDLPRVVGFAWSHETGRYLSRTAWIIFCTLLTVLQILQVLWFGMICRVAWRVISTGKGASDDRSDDEGTDEDKKNH